MGKALTEDLLILTKTYPTPSMNYCETSCVAAINDKGELRRLYPIPFRFLGKEKQFKKWQWIKSKIDKSSDKRLESYNIDIESIAVGETIPTDNHWENRLNQINHLIYPSFSDLENARKAGKCSIGYIRPKSVTFSLVPVKDNEWTDKELKYLLQEGLFESEEIKNRNLLKKLPYEFRYTFHEETEAGSSLYDFMITDWEIGAFYWTCKAQYGDNWENYFRQKMETDLPSKDLIFMMGTVHRFPNIWLIIGLVYPPKHKPDEAIQPLLL